MITHSIRYDVHEKEVGKIALEMGFDQVSLSSTIMPMVRIVPRGYTGKVFKLLGKKFQVLSTAVEPMSPASQQSDALLLLTCS